MKSFYCALLALLAALASGQNPDTVKPPGKCAIEGQVRNAVTGEPLNKAQLTLNKVEGRNFSSYGATTDAGGHFAMKDLDPGSYRLSVERNGYVRAEYGSRGPGRPGASLSLSPGQSLRDLEFRLTPHAVITGRVLDEDGDPVMNVQILPMRYGYVRGRRQLSPAGDAHTNDIGEYRIFGLPPGRYYLVASHRSVGAMTGVHDRTAGRRPGESAPEESYAPTYYPGANDPAGAAALEVAPGAQLRGIDFTLLKTHAVRLRGRVVNPMASRAGRNVMIMLVPRGSYAGLFWQNATPVLDPQGNFELRGVTPGAYILSAHWFDDGRNYSARQPIEVGNSSIDNLSLVISAGLDLMGHVRVDGRPDLKLTDLRVSLLTREPGPMVGSPGGTVRDNGSFVLPNVAAESYTVNLYGMPENLYVKSIRIGNDDVLESGLDLTRGGAGPIEIVLSPDGGQIEGVVLNAQQKPSDGVTVVLVPESGRREQPQFYKNVSTDQYGRFNIKGIAPGDYKLFAWEDVEAGAWQDPDFLKPVEDRGESYSIRENSRESAQLKLIPAEDTTPQKRGAGL